MDKRVLNNFLNTFWIERSLYNFNYNYSMRFDLMHSEIKCEKINFFCSLYNYLFKNSEEILIFRESSFKLTPLLSHIKCKVKKSFNRTFKTKNDLYYFDEKVKQRIYILENFSFNLVDLMNNIYEDKLNSIIYIADINNNIVLNVYDERGCDVLIKDNLKFKETYKKFGEWILEYNREEIIRKINKN